MDKDTILFILSENEAIGYHLDYYRASNYRNTLNPIKIFYKMGDTRETWIDFKRAIQLKRGTYEERLSQAFIDPNFKIINLKEIPKTKYYDKDGFCFEIPPFDGAYEIGRWLSRISFDIENCTYEFVGTDLQDLKVIFPETNNINHAIISLNSLFLPFETLNYHTVVFRGARNTLVKINTIGDLKDQYDIRLAVYVWEGLRKSAPLFPISRNYDMFTLDQPIEDNCLIIYKGVIYDYELNYSNKRQFKLKGINQEALELLELDKIAVYRMVSEDPTIATRKYITRGVGNKYKNSVDFSLQVTNSLILFNGVDNEYEIVDSNSIVYPRSLFSVNYVSNLSFITAVNFTKG